MKAREMFEELGYEYSKSDDNYLLQTCISYFKMINKNYYCIKFWLQDKDYDIEGKTPFTLKLVQAINKQIEELGWLDEKTN